MILPVEPCCTRVQNERMSRETTASERRILSAISKMPYTANVVRTRLRPNMEPILLGDVADWLEEFLPILIQVTKDRAKERAEQLQLSNEMHVIETIIQRAVRPLIEELEGEEPDEAADYIIKAP